MRYHFTPIRMAIIKKVITSVAEDGEPELTYTAGGYVKIQSGYFGKQSGSFSKVNQRVTILAPNFLGIYSREMKMSCSPKTCIRSFFHGSIIFNRQKVEIMQIFN